MASTFQRRGSNGCSYRPPASQAEGHAVGPQPGQPNPHGKLPRTTVQTWNTEAVIQLGPRMAHGGGTKVSCGV